MDFYYGLRLANPTAGAISAGVFTPSAETTNYGLLIDADIDVSCKIPYNKLANPATDSAVRFAVDGTAKYHFSDMTDDFSDVTDKFSELEAPLGFGKADVIVFYRTAKSPDSYINIHSSNNATTGYTEVLGTTGFNSQDIGWQITNITPSVKGYFIVNTTNYSKLEVSELMLGQGLTGFPQYDIGKIDKAKPFVTKEISYSGIEATNKKTDTSFIYEFTWGGLSEDNKNLLVDLRNAIWNRGRGFLMVDNGVYTFVRLMEDIIVEEVAYRLYRVHIKLDPIRPLAYASYNTFGRWLGTFGGTIETFGAAQKGFNTFGFWANTFGAETKTFGDAT